MSLVQIRLDWGAFAFTIAYFSVVERSVELCLKQSFYLCMDSLSRC